MEITALSSDSPHACRNCAKAKLKCDRASPCGRCRQRKLQCETPTDNRSGRPEHVDVSVVEEPPRIPEVLAPTQDGGSVQLTLETLDSCHSQDINRRICGGSFAPVAFPSSELQSSDVARDEPETRRAPDLHSSVRANAVAAAA